MCCRRDAIDRRIAGANRLSGQRICIGGGGRRAAVGEGEQWWQSAALWLTERGHQRVWEICIGRGVEHTRFVSRDFHAHARQDAQLSEGCVILAVAGENVLAHVQILLVRAYRVRCWQQAEKARIRDAAGVRRDADRAGTVKALQVGFLDVDAVLILPRIIALIRASGDAGEGGRPKVAVAERLRGGTLRGCL